MDLLETSDQKENLNTTIKTEEPSHLFKALFSSIVIDMFKKQPTQKH
jgi:hypothetical protein